MHLVLRIIIRARNILVRARNILARAINIQARARVSLKFFTF